MKIRMIYLAAGDSRRFGSNKLLYHIDGKPMFAHGLDTLMKVLEEMEEVSLTVVTNYPEIEEYAAACRKASAEKMPQTPVGERICTVKSPCSHKGISHSIRAGLLGFDADDSLPFAADFPAQPDADYYLFCVADQPYISSKTIVSLLQETIKGGYVGGYVEWQGKSGNPAVFSKELFGELSSLQGDIGGKRLLVGRENVCRVSAGRREEMEDVDFCGDCIDG